MKNNFVDKSIEELKLKKVTIDKLNNNNIKTINELWVLKRKDLKSFKLTDTEINQIIIQLQLNGLDLNKKVY